MEAVSLPLVTVPAVPPYNDRAWNVVPPSMLTLALVETALLLASSLPSQVVMVSLSLMPTVTSSVGAAAVPPTEALMPVKVWERMGVDMVTSRLFGPLVKVTLSGLSGSYARSRSFPEISFPVAALTLMVAALSTSCTV